MSNDLVSLDDIIKKSKTSSAGMRSRGRPRKPPIKNGPRANGTAPKPNSQPRANKPIEDARFKIIQKKRKTITDARDKLAQIAKQSDARLKLQKLRSSTKKIDHANIPRKGVRNGRMPMAMHKQPPSRLSHSMHQGFLPSSRTMGYRSPPMSQSQYMNEMLMSYADAKFSKPKDYDYLPYRTKEYLMDQAALSRTVSNNYAPSLPPPPPLFNVKSIPYDWDKPSHANYLSRSQSIKSSEHRPRDYKVIPRSAMTKIESTPVYNRDEWLFGSKSRFPAANGQSSGRMRSGRSTILPEASLDPKYYSMRNHRDAGVKSRLDSPPSKVSRTLGSSSRPKASAPSTGYRIVVSNLQSNVTQEDIKELFEDVGELLISRLVRPGIAEVIYKTLKDATKAVETYHNRQLDGHPMKCLLVNPRPKSSSTASSRVLSQSRSTSYGVRSLAPRSSLFHD